MAQEGFDTLMDLTESRYRLSMVTARRAAQLKLGVPSVLPKDETPKTRNTVTIAMKELEAGAGVLTAHSGLAPGTYLYRLLLDDGLTRRTLAGSAVVVR